MTTVEREQLYAVITVEQAETNPELFAACSSSDLERCRRSLDGTLLLVEWSPGRGAPAKPPGLGDARIYDHAEAWTLTQALPWAEEET